MLKPYKIFLVRFFLPALLLGGFLVGCQKPVEDFSAQVLVLDSLGNPIPDAEVVLECKPTPPESECVVKRVVNTNARGFASFEFDDPVTLLIRAVKRESELVFLGGNPRDPVNYIQEIDSICGEGFIVISDGEETATQTVVLLSCPDP